MKKLKLILCLTLGCLLMFGCVGGQAAGKRLEMDKAKAIATLQVGFDYSEAELGKYLDQGMSYKELKNICMHALAAMFPCKRLWTYATSTVGQELSFCLVLLRKSFTRASLTTRLTGCIR